MSLRNLILVGLVLMGVGAVAASGLAQLPDQTNRIYTLVSGSEMTDTCPFCAEFPILMPMTGTFVLRFLDQNPILTRYELLDIAFQAGVKGGLQYAISGTGTYQVGGEVAVAQEIFLDLNIGNGSTNTAALCINQDQSVSQPWPEIQIAVSPTNATPGRIIHLTLVAVPALQFLATTPDYRNNNVLLQWDSDGHQVQLERAVTVGGPYSPVSPITTNETFTDEGALTNQALFYRLHQY